MKSRLLVFVSGLGIWLWITSIEHPGAANFALLLWCVGWELLIQRRERRLGVPPPPPTSMDRFYDGPNVG